LSYFDTYGRVPPPIRFLDRLLLTNEVGRGDVAGIAVGDDPHFAVLDELLVFGAVVAVNAPAPHATENGPDEHRHGGDRPIEALSPAYASLRNTTP